MRIEELRNWGIKELRNSELRIFLFSLFFGRFLLSVEVAFSHEEFLSDIALSRKVLAPMALTTDAIYHLSLLFILSIIVLPLRRSSLVALVVAIPALTEIVQFFMPGRIPDFMDAFHGYLGIILAYCLVQMWREIAPVVRKFRLQFDEPEIS